MSRGWLVVALLVSLGVNVGLVGVGIARRQAIERRLERLEARELGGERGLAGPEARPGPGERPRPGERAGAPLKTRLADRLGLEGERRERFLAALAAMGDEIAAARAEIGAARSELRREIAARAPDRARIDALLARLATAENRLNRALVDGVLAARAELEPDEVPLFLRAIAEAGLARGPGEAPPPGPRERFLRRRFGERRDPPRPREAPP